MVSPIMKSDMVKRSSQGPVVLDDSSALPRRIIDPSKGVRRRDTVSDMNFFFILKFLNFHILVF